MAVMACTACGPKEAPLGAGPSGEAAPASGPARPVAASSLSFVGHWAATKTGCAREPWVFTAGGLSSPDVLSCTFGKINPTDAGYSVTAICAVGNAWAPGQLLFTMTGAGAARSLTMSGGPFSEPVALERCAAKPPLQVQAASSVASRGG